MKRNVVCIILLFMLLHSVSCDKQETKTNNSSIQGAGMKKKILLIGASVGQDWNLAQLPHRMHETASEFESLAVYQYDKSDAIEEVLMRPRRKFRFSLGYVKGFFRPAPQLPNMIILKECAAYFPGDLNQYKVLMQKWVNRIRGAHISLMVATVAPITKTRAARKEHQLESILEFNDWIREYCVKERIPLLDLERALRESDRNRVLQEKFTSGDGLHLNKEAYDVLDRLLLSRLSDMHRSESVI